MHGKYQRRAGFDLQIYRPVGLPESCPHCVDHSRSGRNEGKAKQGEEGAARHDRGGHFHSPSPCPQLTPATRTGAPASVKTNKRTAPDSCTSLIMAGSITPSWL